MLLTRDNMHIGIDLAIKKLDGIPSYRLNALVKDFFLNKTISDFVINSINKANNPDELKRVPFRILTHGDILSKYNEIYTLIKFDDSLLPITQVDNSFYQYILPTDLFRFETSSTNVRPIDCITYPSASAPILVASAGTGVTVGLHYYFVTFVYPTLETDINGINVSTITVTAPNGYVDLSNIPLGLTGCTARKIYRSKVGEAWYKARLLTTISNNSTTTFQDTVADASLGDVYAGNLHDTNLPNLLLSPYDITAFNDNPYGGGKKYIGTVVENNPNTSLSGYLKLYHLGRYAISKVIIIYIKKPAVLSANVTQCDLPENVHQIILDETIKYISTTANNGSLEDVLKQIKQ